jgi:hypothetical protein
MQALSRNLMLVIASLLIPFLLAEGVIADPSVSTTHDNKTVAVANLAQQTESEGSQRRQRLSKLSQPQGIAVGNTTGKLY